MLRIKQSFLQQEIPYLGNPPFKTRIGYYQLDRLEILTRQERILTLALFSSWHFLTPVTAEPASRPL